MIDWKLVGIIIAAIGDCVMYAAGYFGLSYQILFGGVGIVMFGLAVYALESAGLIPRLGAVPP